MPICIIESRKTTSKLTGVSRFRIPDVEEHLELARKWIKYAKESVKLKFEDVVATLEATPLSNSNRVSRRLIVNRFCDSTRVCQLHFTQECFISVEFGKEYLRQKLRLKPDSVPTLNLPNVVDVINTSSGEEIQETSASETSDIALPKYIEIGIQTDPEICNETQYAAYAHQNSKEIAIQTDCFIIDNFTETCTQLEIELEVSALQAKNIATVSKDHSYFTSSKNIGDDLSDADFKYPSPSRYGTPTRTYYSSPQACSKEKYSSPSSTLSVTSGETKKSTGTTSSYEPSPHSTPSSNYSPTLPKSIPEGIVEERKYIVFESQLKQLLCRLRCEESNCESVFDITENFQLQTSGSQLTVKMASVSGHEFVWYAQPLVGRILAGNLLLASSILLSGATFQRIYSIFEFMGLVYQKAYFLLFAKKLHNT